MFGFLKKISRLLGIKSEHECQDDRMFEPQGLRLLSSSNLPVRTPATLKRIVRFCGPDPSRLASLICNEVGPIFTQELTKCREKKLRKVLSFMSPEQHRVMKARGWDKGLLR